VIIFFSYFIQSIIANSYTIKFKEAVGLKCVNKDIEQPFTEENKVNNYYYD